MAIDNPWPDRQDRADEDAAQQARREEFWVARNRQMALEILSARYELEREFENEMGYEMDESLEDFFNISRADVRKYENQHGRKTL